MGEMGVSNSRIDFLHFLKKRAWRGKLQLIQSCNANYEICDFTWWKRLFEIRGGGDAITAAADETLKIGKFVMKWVNFLKYFTRAWYGKLNSIQKSSWKVENEIENEGKREIW